MLKIRMQRVGRINQPSFRIVVVEHTASTKAGKFVDKVGTYNPKTKERKLDEVRIKHWMSVGAKPSDTVHNMLVSAGILNAKKINVLPKFVEKKTEEAPVSGVQPAEAPVEEVKGEEVKEEAKEVAPTPEGVGVPTSPTPASENVGI